jgi:hypothetical protein
MLFYKSLKYLTVLMNFILKNQIRRVLIEKKVHFV